MTIANNVKSTIPKTESTKDNMKFVEERSQSIYTDKSSTKTLIGTLVSTKFDSSCTMQELVSEMTNIKAKMKFMGKEANEIFIVQFIRNFLLSQHAYSKWVKILLRISGMFMNCIIWSFKRWSNLRKQRIHLINLMGQ